MEQVGAAEVRFSKNLLQVNLTDGRKISAPMDRIEWLSWLARATPEQRSNWTIEPGGYAVYWEDLDDGVEIRHLLEMEPLI